MYRSASPGHLRDGKIAEAWEIADVGSLIDQVRSN